jgi:hypothetical protein
MREQLALGSRLAEIDPSLNGPFYITLGSYLTVGENGRYRKANKYLGSMRRFSFKGRPFPQFYI